MQVQPPRKTIATSGGFDPIHEGHLACFREAKRLGDWLIVIVNSDKWLVRKKGYALTNQETRAEIIRSFKFVDEVIIYESESDDVCGALKMIRPDIFAKGGDRVKGNVPEEAVCKELGIEIVYNVGGGKVASSSDAVRRACKIIHENESA